MRSYMHGIGLVGMGLMLAAVPGAAQTPAPIDPGTLKSDGSIVMTPGSIGGGFTISTPITPGGVMTELTMPRVKRLAAGQEQIDAVITANPRSTFFPSGKGTSDSTWTANLIKDFKASPRLVAALQAAGTTPENQASDYVRIQRALAYLAEERAALAAGKPAPMVPTTSPVTANDIAFVRKNEDALKILGLKVSSVAR